MVGITLTAEEIRAAPPEVRHWLEIQIASLAGGAGEHETHPAAHALVGCSAEEVRAVLDRIQHILPVVGVLFELGREAPGTVAQGVRVFQLQDIQRHVRLRSAEQVLECLTLINAAVQEIRNDPSCMICAYDHHGRCFVAEATARAILGVWQDIVAARALQPMGAPGGPAAPQPMVVVPGPAPG